MVSSWLINPRLFFALSAPSPAPCQQAVQLELQHGQARQYQADSVRPVIGGEQALKIGVVHGSGKTTISLCTLALMKWLSNDVSASQTSTLSTRLKRGRVLSLKMKCIPTCRAWRSLGITKLMRSTFDIPCILSSHVLLLTALRTNIASCLLTDASASK